jgi:uncharacterized membrane protein YdjX (TVP38/TMEM64 family)
MQVAFPMCCVLCAVGASACYWMSNFLGRDIIVYWMPQKLHLMQSKITSQEMGLLPYLIFIRLFPFTPNSFINLASPLLNVPYVPFVISVFIGLMPYNFITIQAGDLVNELHSTKDIFSVSTICKMVALSIAFLSVFLAKRFVVPRLQWVRKSLFLLFELS